MDEFMKQHLANQERIAKALEGIAANGGGGFVAPAADKPADKPAIKPADKPATKLAEKPAEPEAPAEPEGPTYTIDEVRAALKEYRAIEGAPAMLEVLKTHGGKEALTEVDPKHFPAIMEAVGAAKA